MDSQILEKQITAIETHFNTACQQIILLNSKLDALQTRYDRAMKDQLRTHRYNHRLKLSSLEGVRNMLVEYASMKADQLTDIHEQMLTARRRRSERLQRRRRAVDRVGDDDDEDDAV